MGRPGQSNVERQARIDAKREEMEDSAAARLPNADGGSDSHRRLRQDPGWWGAECASHEVEAAPGYAIYVAGTLDGKRQTLRIDPEEVDELARRLHQAKRVSRGKR